MNAYKEVTAENLRFIRGGNGMNQAEVAELLGIQKNAISKIEGGTRSLTEAEKHLLDWYFFGKVPPRLVASLDLRGYLEFTPDEWNVLGILATRRGQSHNQFIKATILSIIHGPEGEIAAKSTAKQTPVYKAAEDPTPYKA